MGIGAGVRVGAGVVTATAVAVAVVVAPSPPPATSSATATTPPPLLCSDCFGLYSTTAMPSSSSSSSACTWQHVNHDPCQVSMQGRTETPDQKPLHLNDLSFYLTALAEFIILDPAALSPKPYTLNPKPINLI